MQCPRCEAEMVTFAYQDVEIDQCQQCHGVWLDEDELALLGNHAEAQAFLELLISHKRASIKCPRCNKRMRLANMQDVEIDICPHNHGLWFDQGEIDAIVQHHELDQLPALQRSLADLFGISFH